jgi:putative ABC transport system permease protein
MGMQLIAGKNISPALIHDSITPMIINETMMRSFGWQKENAVGQQIRPFQGGIAVVTGVVKNFNFRPLSEPVRNQVFITSKDKGFVNFYVRIGAGNPSPILAAIQHAWNNVMPGVPMKYSFLDEDINSYYKSEQTWSRIVGWASAISIVLACLGLLGLSSLAAVNRTKEIGIRKVLGASVPGIVTLMSKDFLKLILIAFFIASPIAWYLMHAWLQDYAVRIDISWVVFLLAGASVVVIAIISISFHAIRAALTNPSRSLRTE